MLKALLTVIVKHVIVLGVSEMLDKIITEYFKLGVLHFGRLRDGSISINPHYLNRIIPA